MPHVEYVELLSMSFTRTAHVVLHHASAYVHIVHAGRPCGADVTN